MQGSVYNMIQSMEYLKFLHHVNINDVLASSSVQHVNDTSQKIGHA